MVGGLPEALPPTFLSLASLLHHLLASSSLSSLTATLTNLPVNVANKGLTVILSSLDATLTKTRGGGNYQWLSPTRILYTCIALYWSCHVSTSSTDPSHPRCRSSGTNFCTRSGRRKAWKARREGFRSR